MRFALYENWSKQNKTNWIFCSVGPHHIIENGPVPQGIYLFFITAFVITHGRCDRLRMDVCCLFHRVIVKMKPEIIICVEIIIHFFEFTGSRQRVIKNNFWEMDCTILIDFLYSWLEDACTDKAIFRIPFEKCMYS